MKLKSTLALATIISAALFTGCASSVPKAKFTQQLPAGSQLRANDQAKASVTAEARLDILPMEKERLAQRIEERINSKKVQNPAAGAEKRFAVEVHLTRYDKGSAFARAMLAGLGQIHIDGTVTVFELPGKNQLAKFDISKSFAWGGIYGASTGMEEIELTFAEGIAAAVTGRAEEPTPTSQTKAKP